MNNNLKSSAPVVPYIIVPPYEGDGSVYMATYNYNVPIGTTLAVAASLVSIWTGVPASKVGQTFVLFFGVSLSVLLDNLILVETSQYRTPEMVQEPGMTYPQYKYKNLSSWYYKSYSNKISGPHDSGWWLSSKPY